MDASCLHGHYGIKKEGARRFGGRTRFVMSIQFEVRRQKKENGYGSSI